jgi:hypothetical protein
MYFFHLRDQDTIHDVDGTDLADHDAAREHAETVAKELKFKTSTFEDEAWSRWTMHVHDADGEEVFSFPMGDVNGGDGK